MARLERVERVHRHAPPAHGGGGTGIEPEAAERVAAAEAADREPAAARSAPWTSTASRRVLRARRDVAARRQSVGGQPLVEVDQCAARRGCAERSVTACSGCSVAQRSRGTWLRSSRYEVARPRPGRRRRGRRAPGASVAASAAHGGAEAAADPVARDGAADPAADGVGDARRVRRVRRGAQVTVRTPRRRRRPAASARNDARSRTRQIRPTGGCGPWPGAA